jgi:WD40 repeat protein
VSGFGLWNFKGFEFRGGPVAFSPDGQLLAAAGAQAEGGRDNPPETTVHVLDARTGSPLRRLDFRGPLYSLAWLPDSRHLLVGCGGDLRVWEVNEPAEVTTFPIGGLFSGGLEYAASLAVDPTGQLLLVGTSGTQKARLLSLPTGQELLALEASQGTCWFRLDEVTAVALTPDGLFALTGTNDGAARAWSVRSGEEVCRFTGHAGWWGFRAVTGVAFLPGGERALSSCEDGTLCLWDARTGQELKRWDHKRGIRRLALSPDGRLAVTGAWEGSLRVWYLD